MKLHQEKLVWLKGLNDFKSMHKSDGISYGLSTPCTTPLSLIGAELFRRIQAIYDIFPSERGKYIGIFTDLVTAASAMEEENGNFVFRAEDGLSSVRDILGSNGVNLFEWMKFFSGGDPLQPSDVLKELEDDALLTAPVFVVDSKFSSLLCIAWVKRVLLNMLGAFYDCDAETDDHYDIGFSRFDKDSFLNQAANFDVIFKCDIYGNISFRVVNVQNSLPDVEYNEMFFKAKICSIRSSTEHERLYAENNVSIFAEGKRRKVLIIDRTFPFVSLNSRIFEHITNASHSRSGIVRAILPIESIFLSENPLAGFIESNSSSSYSHHEATARNNPDLGFHLRRSSVMDLSSEKFELKSNLIKEAQGTDVLEHDEYWFHRPHVRYRFEYLHAIGINIPDWFEASRNMREITKVALLKDGNDSHFDGRLSFNISTDHQSVAPELKFDGIVSVWDYAYPFVRYDSKYKMRQLDYYPVELDAAKEIVLKFCNHGEEQQLAHIMKNYSILLDLYKRECDLSFDKKRFLRGLNDTLTKVLRVIEGFHL